MIVNPEKWIDTYAQAGADQFTFHIEAAGSLAAAFLFLVENQHVRHLHFFFIEDPVATIAAIKAAGMKAGAAISPGTRNETSII